MKVFVAGATGVLGRRAVPLLVGAGHDVTALARTEERAGLLLALGARPVMVDLFDPDALRGRGGGFRRGVQPGHPHPGPESYGRPGAWASNDRIRTVGSDEETEKRSLFQPR